MGYQISGVRVSGIKKKEYQVSGKSIKYQD